MKKPKNAALILGVLLLMLIPTYAIGAGQSDEGFGKSYILFPLASSDSTTNGTAYGFLYLSRQLSAAALYNNNEYRMFYLFSNNYLDDGQFLVTSLFAYGKSNSTFYGIGNEDFSAPGEDYQGKTDQFGGGFFVRLTDGLYLGPTVSASRFSVSDVEAGGQLAQGTITGYNGSDAVGIGLELKSDQRDDPGFPTEGYLLDIKTLFYNPDFGSDLKFSQSSATYSQFIPVAMGGVWVLKGRIVYTHGEDIPFQMLPSLGEGDIMRGIEGKKDINRDLIAVASDYRFHITEPLTATIFVGLGDVANSFSEIQMDKFVKGFELRYNFLGPFKLYLIRGYGKHDIASYVGINAWF